ncbi:hypothetical protein [Spirosoma linguale]|uniref:Uncharacterized protein n=1 Tax=Spirosoma linguale (strain ATCC 33905 / DSM 74 / LMG 10896 / Claus 1) TaxID=504472 RepID=D2QIF6_SPILD|nr:hypothetical protein Slin_2724 [Spirosoma linguale DSM 74]
MKTLLLYVYLSILASQPILAQFWTKEDIKKQLPLFIRALNYPLGNDKFHLTYNITTDSIPPNHPLFKLFKNHDLYISYLLSRYSTIDYQSIFKPNTPFPQADRAFRQALTNDTLLNHCFLETATYYLKAQEIPLKDISVLPKQSLTMPTLLAVAARFFNHLETRPNDHVAWFMNLKGTPDYDASEVGNQPLIEAFCSEAIMKWSFLPEWSQLPYERRFYEEVEALTNRTALLTDAKDKRELVRPAMRDLMTHSKELEKALLTEYELSKEWLGFTLIK